MKILMAAAIATALIGSASAQSQAYPSKPLRMIVPYTPGGSIDTVGRLVADEMQKILGQSFVVDNKPGASGMIGANEAARAPADG